MPSRFVAVTSHGRSLWEVARQSHVGIHALRLTGAWDAPEAEEAPGWRETGYPRAFG